MELIDAHTHLTYEPLAADIGQVLSRSRLVGVRRWVTVGTDAEHIRRAVDLAAGHDGLYAAVGIHPHHAAEATDADLALLREYAGRPRVVAVGETGLDFHYNFSKQDRQCEVFRAELAIAAETQLPVIIHSRNAFDETLAILDEFAGRLKRVVFHCYSGTAEQARLVLDRGWFVSFTGIVTFKNADETRRAAAAVPLERMMIETDCPYISPEPVRNIRPCEPALMIHTAQKIADQKGLSLDEFARRVTATTAAFFALT